MGAWKAFGKGIVIASGIQVVCLGEDGDGYPRQAADPRCVYERGMSAVTTTRPSPGSMTGWNQAVWDKGITE